MFSGKKILITGGSGSLGTSLVKKLLKTNVSTIRIFSRDELKQTEMASKISDNRLRFMIGDVRDKDRVNRALEGIDIVIHAAALKHVPVAEYNPFEAVKTNVTGAQNIIDGCLENDVKIALAIGTDKAVSPLNTYGATKLLMERLFISANFFKGEKKCKFVCVRYGNVLGSRGSAFPKFIEQIRKTNSITMTDPSMTRFNITMNDALDLIFRTLKNTNGGEVFVPKLKTYRLDQLVDCISKFLETKPKIKKINVRPGEKFHELLISKDEIRDVYENKDDFIILPDSEFFNYPNKSKLKKAKLNDAFSSDHATQLTNDELLSIFKKDNLIQNILKNQS